MKALYQFVLFILAFFWLPLAYYLGTILSFTKPVSNILKLRNDEQRNSFAVWFAVLSIVALWLLHEYALPVQYRLAVVWE